MTYASWGAVGSGTSARAAAPAMSIQSRAIVERAPAMRVDWSGLTCGASRLANL